MDLPEVLRSLLTSRGPSGYESASAAALADACRGFTDDVEIDVMGSVTARVAGTGDGPTVAFIGHIDQIGLVVTHIDDEGLLRFAGIGGWDPMILVGQRVTVETAGGPVLGVVGKKPIHLLSADERKKVPELKDLHIDIGATDADDARGAVRVGDAAVPSGEPVALRGGRWASTAMDNRLGCYVAYEAARRVAEAGGACGDVIAVGAVQEETGLSGAQTLGHRLDLDAAIVVDVTHAAAPGVDPATHGKHEFGSGPVIERGVTLHPRVFELLHAAAEAEQLPFTVAASGGSTFTDADALHAARAGVPTGLVGLPLRYMHSPVEVMQLSDIEHSAQLLAAFALALDAGEPFARA